MSHPRFVDVGRTFNFRDLGGYPTEGGGSVRWRTLYRADVPVTPSDTDRHELGALNLRTVIDLRAVSETGPRDGHVDDATEHHTLAVGMADDWQHYDAGVDLRRFLADRYLLTAERSAANSARPCV